MVRYGLALALIALCACSREAPVRTRDDIAADSALAADLALANRDTLAIGSGERWLCSTGAGPSGMQPSGGAAVQ